MKKMEIEKWGDSHRLTVYGLESKEPFQLAFASDLHLDSKEHDKKSFDDFMGKVVDRDAPLFLFGDTSDLMQGKGDPRKRHGDIKRSLLDGSYLNQVKSENIEILEPYINHIKMMTNGNHEKSTISHYGFDMTRDIVDTLNLKGGNMVMGDYGGYIIVKLMIDTRRSVSYIINYHHGKSLAMPESLAKKNGLRIDSHLVISGHTHRNSKQVIEKERLTSGGMIKLWEQWHIETAGFKFMGEWEKENRFDRRSRGGCFVTIWHEGGNMLKYNEPELIRYL